MREADAGALAAVPDDDLGLRVGQQAGGREQAVVGVAIRRRIAAAEHRRAREVERHLGQLAADAQRDPLDHRVADGVMVPMKWRCPA
jgi:hypothetical protein